MKINQLFTRRVDLDVVLQLVKCIGLSGLDDSKNFTRYDLARVNAVTQVYAMVEVLRQYYLPCKAKLYLTEITDKKIITIVKQVLRLHNYSMLAKEKNHGNKKVIVYRVVNNGTLFNEGMHQTQRTSQVDFA